MDLKEYILPVSSMIGGWYIPPAVCDDLVTLFKESEEYQQPGVVGPLRVLILMKKDLPKFLSTPLMIIRLW